MSKPATKAAASKPAATKLKPQLAVPRAPNQFNLGDVLRCRLTGATGIAVSCIEYLYGCRRWGLLPADMADGKPVDWLHFDELQLERVATAAGTAQPVRVTGGPRPDGVGRPNAPAR